MQKKTRSISLRERLLLVLTIVVVLCLALLALVSYTSMSSMEQTRLRTSLVLNIQQISGKIRQDYDSLLLLSQQMMPVGNIGSLVEEYISSATPYERIRSSRDMSDSIGQAAFVNRHIELVMYYDEQNDGNTFLSNLPLKEDFFIGKIPLLSKTKDVSFQAIHKSECRFSGSNVISIIRPIVFSNGKEVVIYAESSVEVLENINTLSEMQGIEYVFVQLDNNDFVKYSSSPDIVTGTHMSLSNLESDEPDTGKWGKYVWSRVEMSSGCSNVLLMPISSYEREINTWKFGLIVVAFFAALVIFFTSLVLFKLVYKPLQLLEKEMLSFGKGDMIPQMYYFGIAEYDNLFTQFNTMKNRIKTLMENVRNKEDEKRQLELDKLYYQINPHFLMNALNSARWMAVIHHQDEISSFLSKLNYLLSYSLGKTQQNTTLRTELRVIESYLELQQIRYDFNIYIDTEQGIYLDRPCARLILQPLAENSVCHSLNDGGNIWVNTHIENDKIIIAIRDDGTGFDVNKVMAEASVPGEENRSGIGLRYVRLTLESFYNGQADIKVESQVGVGTTVTLVLPNIRDADLDDTDKSIVKDEEQAKDV